MDHASESLFLVGGNSGAAAYVRKDACDQVNIRKLEKGEVVTLTWGFIKVLNIRFDL